MFYYYPIGSINGWIPNLFNLQEVTIIFICNYFYGKFYSEDFYIYLFEFGLHYDILLEYFSFSFHFFINIKKMFAD